jgi:hypothetical protein
VLRRDDGCSVRQLDAEEPGAVRDLDVQYAHRTTIGGEKAIRSAAVLSQADGQRLAYRRSAATGWSACSSAATTSSIHLRAGSHQRATFRSVGLGDIGGSQPAAARMAIACTRSSVFRGISRMPDTSPRGRRFPTST